MSDLDEADGDFDMGDEGDMLAEMEMIMAIQIQKRIRGFIVRSRRRKYVHERFEKIWDPRRDKHYFYDTEEDTAAWKLPLVFRKFEPEFEIAPTFLPDDGARVIQTMARRVAALCRVRIMYKEQWEEVFDFYSSSNYYANRKTYQSSWMLPKFMKGVYDHEVKPKDDEEDVDSKLTGDENEAEESEIDSQASDYSEQVRERRRKKRIYPRSLAQQRLDAVEDDVDKEVTELDLSNMKLEFITPRLFDMYWLTVLKLNGNNLSRISDEIQYMNNLTYLDLRDNNLPSIPEEFEGLTQLETLLLGGNRLKKLPGALFMVKSLRKVDFSRNLFKDMPVETGNLELLKITKEWEVGVGQLKYVDVFVSFSAPLLLCFH
jgi:hypothetical protein